MLGPTPLTFMLATALAGTSPVKAMAEDNWPTFFSHTVELWRLLSYSRVSEEIGWTGFLLDRVQERYRPLRSPPSSLSQTSQNPIGRSTLPNGVGVLVAPALLLVAGASGAGLRARRR